MSQKASSTVQRLLCEAILPIVEAAYQEEDGDGLPMNQREKFENAAKRYLYNCPMVNIPTFIKLNEAFDQPLLMQTILHCIGMIKSNFKEEKD